MNLADYPDHHLEEELRRRRDAVRARRFEGRNVDFLHRIEELKHRFYGPQTWPNFRLITAAEFAAHPVVSSSYRPQLISTPAIVLPSMPHARWPRVLLMEVDHWAGHGAGFVSIPADPKDWDKSQHYTVKLKLQSFAFHLCDHEYESRNTGNCLHEYTCKHCGWTYDVDSSG